MPDRLPLGKGFAAARINVQVVIVCHTTTASETYLCDIDRILCPDLAKSQALGALLASKHPHCTTCAATLSRRCHLEFSHDQCNI